MPTSHAQRSTRFTLSHRGDSRFRREESEELEEGELLRETEWSGRRLDGMNVQKWRWGPVMADLH